MEEQEAAEAHLAAEVALHPADGAASATAVDAVVVVVSEDEAEVVSRAAVAAEVSHGVDEEEVVAVAVIELFALHGYHDHGPAFWGFWVRLFFLISLKGVFKLSEIFRRGYLADNSLFQ